VYTTVEEIAFVVTVIIIIIIMTMPFDPQVDNRYPE
jgi:hypothetical protein